MIINALKYSLIFAGVLLFLMVPIKIPFSYYDEGFAVYNATRIMDGDIPYKDFWAIYPPGQFYVLAAIFKIFGTTAIVARFYDTCTRFIIVFLIYFIAKRIKSDISALFACVSSTLLLSSVGFYTYAVFPSLAIALFALVSALRYEDTGQSRWLVLSGVCVGFASLFRLDLGLYVGVAITVTILFFTFYQTAQSRNSFINQFLVSCKAVLLLVSGALTIMLPFYCYIILTSGFSSFWSQVIVFPITMLHQVRWRPYPTILPCITITQINYSALREFYFEILKWLWFYFPLATYFMAFITIIRQIFGGRTIFTTCQFGLVAVTTWGMLLFAQALSRFDHVHIVPTSLIAFLVMGLLINFGAIKFKKVLYVGTNLLLLFFFLTVYFAYPIKILIYFANEYYPLQCYSSLERAGCVYVDEDQEYAVKYTREHTKDGESIYVGNQRHDILFVNDIGFYFLAKRPAATFYHELYPGVATTAVVQKEIVHEIESKNVNLVVLFDAPESSENNASSISSGVNYLDKFIRDNYRPVVKFGRYGIWEKSLK